MSPPATPTRSSSPLTDPATLDAAHTADAVFLHAYSGVPCARLPCAVAYYQDLWVVVCVVSGGGSGSGRRSRTGCGCGLRGSWIGVVSGRVAPVGGG
jgi:hypothetical protein